jgi:hypothetical protein
VVGVSEFDDLFAEAEENLKRQEAPEEWGELPPTGEGDRLLTRYLGADKLPPFNDGVQRFIDYPGEPRPFYLKSKAQLDRVLENANVGDIVGLVRGRDKDIGKERAMECWDGWTRPCDEPLGGAPQEDDDGIPF